MLFAARNSLRVLAHIPQIHKAATDPNGASAISYSTWPLFLLANLSTIAYAIVNQGDWWMAACFSVNASCCVAILVASYWQPVGRPRPTSISDLFRACCGAPRERTRFRFRTSALLRS